MSYPEPRYFADEGVVSATYRPVDSAPELVYATGTHIHYLATGASTDGDFGMYRYEMPAAPSGPSAHFHRTMSESFYILSGSIRLYDGSQWVDTSPGDYLYVPPGGIHAFRNESGSPATMLILFAPGAPREGYFEELASIGASGRKLTPEEWTDLYQRHDQYMV
ncbi:cupin domain-containing protein [Tenggerimyces flavus]|uniref:Cupin domain-containing protein n=1 Tax=Tenggerimyces flavus TaxID=1708749 RepID=A0ABV7YQF4_9ACTN|nr:cupin domain-containing protein [Tenggerimyces flavus]MBM7784948.1 mannose-6-phosphate isomerase-like protein (cupin superfamily) [Tenggerimyces flavus]